jgi:hypothetical protein
MSHVEHEVCAPSSLLARRELVACKPYLPSSAIIVGDKLASIRVLGLRTWVSRGSMVKGP